MSLEYNVSFQSIGVNQMISLKPGMIGLSGGNKFIQESIRIFTNSIFSHSFLTMKGPGDVLCALETTATIVNFSPLSNKDKEPGWIQMWEILADPVEIEKASINTFAEYVGCRYGYESYLWFIYRAGARKFRYEPLKMWDWVSHGVTCTELTCYTVENINPTFHGIFEGRDYNTIAPQELSVIMHSNSDKFRCVGWLKPLPAELLYME